jgi:small subunit ribosomal protein S7
MIYITKYTQYEVIANNPTIKRLINALMRDGKKTIASTIVQETLSKIEQRLEKNPLIFVETSIQQIKPSVETKSIRIAGANYIVPVEIKETRQESLALRWLISSARNRKERTMAERLYSELVDAYNLQGTSVKRRDEMHKMAEANRAYAHYRW